MNILRRIERLEAKAPPQSRPAFDLTRLTDAEFGRLNELAHRGPQTWTHSERAEVKAMVDKYTPQ